MARANISQTALSATHLEKLLESLVDVGRGVYREHGARQRDDGLRHAVDVVGVP